MKEIISQATITLIILAIAAIGTYSMIACNNSNASNVDEVQQLRNELENVKKERDLLSDAIRSHIDKTNGDCDDILIEVNHFLNVNNESLKDFDKWSYCY